MSEAYEPFSNMNRFRWAIASALYSARDSALGLGHVAHQQGLVDTFAWRDEAAEAALALETEEEKATREAAGGGAQPKRHPEQHADEEHVRKRGQARRDDALGARARGLCALPRLDRRHALPAIPHGVLPPWHVLPRPV